MEVNMLKKIVLTIALVAFAANSFAAVTAACVSGTSGWPSVITFVPSKSVVLGYESGLGGAASGNNSTYAIASKNSAGDKVFATTSASTAIVSKVAITGAALTTADIPDLPASTSDSTITGGGSWTVM